MQNDNTRLNQRSSRLNNFTNEVLCLTKVDQLYPQARVRSEKYQIYSQVPQKYQIYDTAIAVKTADISFKLGLILKIEMTHAVG